MTIRLCVLASGSSGNATALWNDEGGVLIDIGRSRKYIESALADIGLPLSRLTGILVTHGHGDHLNAGAIGIARDYPVPIYLHETTHRLVSRRFIFPPGSVHHHTRRPFAVGSLSVQPFPIFHDGGYVGTPFGFRISCADGKDTYTVGYMTDTGKTDNAIVDSLLDCDAIVMEANHCPEMVRNSGRHWANKQWVLSDHGHLSNHACAETIALIRERSAKKDAPLHVFMAHLSEDHNTPELALEQVSDTLERRGARGVKLLATHRYERSCVLEIGKGGATRLNAPFQGDLFGDTGK